MITREDVFWLSALLVIGILVLWLRGLQPMPGG